MSVLICRVQYCPSFQASTLGLGTYPSQIRGGVGGYHTNIHFMAFFAIFKLPALVLLSFGVGSIYIMDMLNKGMIHIPGGTQWNGKRCYATQSSAQLKNYTLFIFGIFDLTFSDHSWLWETVTEESETTADKWGLLYFISEEVCILSFMSSSIWRDLMIFFSPLRGVTYHMFNERKVQDLT